MEKNLKYFLTFIVIFSISIFIYSFSLDRSDAKIFFLNVGQGNATLIESENGNQILVDGGRGMEVISQLGEVMKYGDKEIDVIVITHYDFDHIGGLDLVLDKYKVEAIVVNGAPLSNKESKNLFKIIKNKNIKVYKAYRGSEIKFGENDLVEFLYPFSDREVSVGNEGSLVMQTKVNDIKILITGDADKKIESLLVNINGKKLESNILKIGHHGSKSSSDYNFLKIVNPEVAIISAGFNNQYGHPHKDVVDRINSLGIPIIETKDGTALLHGLINELRKN